MTHRSVQNQDRHYEIIAHFPRAGILDELRQKTLPWTGVCGDICCSLISSSNQHWSKCEVTSVDGTWKVRFTEVAGTGTSQSNRLSLPRVYHVDHDNRHVFGFDPSVQHLKCPLLKIREILYMRWNNLCERGGLSGPVNQLQFMIDMSDSIVSVLNGKHCCICLQPCAIGNETRLSTGPCGNNASCDKKFENPLEFGMFPIFDSHKGALDNMAENFLVSAFVAHLAMQRHYTEAQRLIPTWLAVEASGFLQNITVEFESTCSKVLASSNAPLFLYPPLKPLRICVPESKRFEFHEKVLTILESIGNHHISDIEIDPGVFMEASLVYNKLLHWIRRTHHGFLYHVTSQHRERIIGDSHLILLKPSCEARLESFHQARMGAGVPNRSAFGFHGSPLKWWHNILRKELCVIDSWKRHNHVYLANTWGTAEAYCIDAQEIAKLVKTELVWTWSKYGANVRCVGFVEYLENTVIPNADPACICVPPHGTIVRALLISTSSRTMRHQQKDYVYPANILHMLRLIKADDPFAAEMLDWLPDLQP